MADYNNLFGGTNQQNYFFSKILNHDYNFSDAPDFNNPAQDGIEPTGHSYRPTSSLFNNGNYLNSVIPLNNGIPIDKKGPSNGVNIPQNNVPNTRIDNGIYPSAMPTIGVTGVTANGTINTYDRGNSGYYPTLPTINVTGVSENGTTNTFTRNPSNPLRMDTRYAGQVDNPYLESARVLQTGVTPYRELPNSQKQPWYRSSDPVPLLGINTDYGAFSLGQAIGSPNGTPGKGLGIVAGAGKVIMGLGRNLVSGIADSKDTTRVQRDMRNNQQAYWRSFTTDRSQYVDPNIRYEYGGYQGLFADGGPLDMDKKRSSDYAQNQSQYQNQQQIAVQPRGYSSLDFDKKRSSDYKYNPPVSEIPVQAVGYSQMDMDKKRSSDYLYNPPLNQVPVQPRGYSSLDSDYATPPQRESVLSSLYNINNYHADGGEQMNQDPNQQMPQDQQQGQDQLVQAASQLLNQFKGNVDQIAQYLQQQGVSGDQLDAIMNIVVQMVQQSQQQGGSKDPNQQQSQQQSLRYGGLFADGGEQNTLLNQLQAQQQYGNVQESDQAMEQSQQQGTPTPAQQGSTREQQTINYAMTLVDKFQGDVDKIGKYLKQNGVNPNMAQYLMQYVNEIVQQGDIKQDKDTKKESKSDSSMIKSVSPSKGSSLEFKNGGRKYPKLK